VTETPLAVVADIGGTNTRVALCRGRTVDTGSIRRYRNADHPGIAPILQGFLAETGAKPHAACVDMAGPVTDGVGRLTNLDWRVDAAVLAAATGAATVAVINDMQAQGMAVGTLGSDGLETLLAGHGAAADDRATRLVVNVGTGLNAQPVYRVDGRTLVPPSEAGHVSIPVQNAEELRLRDWLARHCTGGAMPGLEEALSGRGLEHIDAWIGAETGDGPARTAAAVMAAFTAREPRASRAVDVFVRLLGRYTGDLALIAQPVGGIYLVGGVIRHLGAHLMAHGFAEAYRDKGRFAGFMDRFPVNVVTDDYAALTGCAVHLSERLGTPG
jgi:glucokinase